MAEATSARAAEMNGAFAEAIIAGAMEALQGKTGDEHRGSGTETYYTIHIPYPPGSEEHAWFERMLGAGSMKNPDYIDLFERVMKGMAQASEKAGLRAFVTLNCRFDASREDNFLMYIFLS